nr:unnamed protein product [Digitaria exilis]
MIASSPLSDAAAAVRDSWNTAESGTVGRQMRRMTRGAGDARLAESVASLLTFPEEAPPPSADDERAPLQSTLAESCHRVVTKPRLRLLLSSYPAFLLLLLVVSCPSIFSAPDRQLRSVRLVATKCGQRRALTAAGFIINSMRDAVRSEQLSYWPKFTLQPPLIPNPPPPKITHLSSSLLGHLKRTSSPAGLGILIPPSAMAVFSCPFSNLAIGQSSGSLLAMATRSSSCITPTAKLTSSCRCFCYRRSKPASFGFDRGHVTWHDDVATDGRGRSPTCRRQAADSHPTVVCGVVSLVPNPLNAPPHLLLF